MSHTKCPGRLIALAVLLPIVLASCARPFASGEQNSTQGPLIAPTATSAIDSVENTSSIALSAIAPVTVADSVSTPPPSVLATAGQGDPVKVTDDVLSRLDQAAFVSAKVGVAPTKDYSNRHWFYATVKNAGNSWNDLYSVWQAQLAQGAISEKLTTGGALNNVIAGSTFKLQDAAGTVKNIVGGGAGAGASFQRFGSGRTVSTVRASVVKVVTKYGMKVDDLRVFRPLDDAVAISIETPTESALTAAHDLLTDLDPGQYEGFYLQIQLPSGDQLVATGSDGRTGGSVLWLKPGTDFGSSIGVVHS